MKTWQVGPYDDDWVVIVHADTRGEARAKGTYVQFDDFIDMRATRLPSLDGQLITNDTLIHAGFPEKPHGIRIDFVGYIFDCGCEICQESIQGRLAIRGIPY